MDEAQTLLSIFGDEDDMDLDLDLLKQIADAGSQPGQVSDAELESMMREHFGLAHLDVSHEVDDVTAKKVKVIADDSDRDDFSDFEWTIVQALRRKCMDAIQNESSPKKRKAAIEWLFVQGTEDKDGVSFHLSCQMLRSRPWVIQALIQHFLYIRNIPIVLGLPFLADPIPDAIESEAGLHAWMEGMLIVAQLWRFPGIETIQLRDLMKGRMTNEEYETALTKLTDAGMIGNKMGRMYLISRPATFRRTGNKVSWSRSFVGE